MDKIIIRGKVLKGKSRGKLLGFPTANINLNKNIEQGIYISSTKLDGVIYNSLTFIGNAKTFAEKKVKAETFILDFNKNIYGRYISVKLLKRIRVNQKFNGEKELIEQMNKDLEAAKKYFS